MSDKNQNWWMCNECENIFQSVDLPQACPGCQKKCTFVNVTCYVPECGGPDNLDVRLVAARNAEARRLTQ